MEWIISNHIQINYFKCNWRDIKSSFHKYYFCPPFRALCILLSAPPNFQCFRRHFTPGFGQLLLIIIPHRQTCHFKEKIGPDDYTAA